MTLEKQSPCKVNLLLNILGKRPDGFHEVETVMHPVGVVDRLTFQRKGTTVKLTCSDPLLPVDERNLAHRAATEFLKAAGIREGVEIHLEKHIPIAAGLGGGSGNAAMTLLGLNELFYGPLADARLHELAAALGSDVPFFLQCTPNVHLSYKPALALGRGENVRPLDTFAALEGACFLLVHPGFGVSTPWAYQNLARFPDALNGRPGRAENLVRLLNTFDLRTAAPEFYNALQAPVLEKHPLLAVYQEFLRAEGAIVALMSGSGSTTFAIFASKAEAVAVEAKFWDKFDPHWTVVDPI